MNKLNSQDEKCVSLKLFRYLDDVELGQKVAVGQRQLVSVQVFSVGLSRVILFR